MRGEVNDATYIRTFTGKYFWPLDPRAEELDILDIAHSLSHQCRWTGHIREFYSVAQHSVLVSRELPSHLKLDGLLHDASEAYLVDLARPIKNAPGLGEIYKEVEAKLEKVISERYGTFFPIPSEVKLVDSQLLMTEKRDLMTGTWNSLHTGDAKDLPFKIIPWPPKEAERAFLTEFSLLTSPETFSTSEFAEKRGVHRGTALKELTRLEKEGIVERARILMNQGGVVRPNVLGWRFLSGKFREDIKGQGGRGRGISTEIQEVVVEGDSASGRGGPGGAVVGRDVPRGEDTDEFSSWVR